MNEEKKIEIPKLSCIGCQKRDEIIRVLAKEVDRLNGVVEKETKAKKTELKIAA